MVKRFVKCFVRGSEHSLGLLAAGLGRSKEVANLN